MDSMSLGIQTKRQKQSSASSDGVKEENEDEKEDTISNLPDAMLTNILTLLPEADAHRTRILSNRWKDLWAFLPNLTFVMPFCWSMEEVEKFHDSVDQTLTLRGGMPIERFSLYCSKNCYYDRVAEWVRAVIKCKVQELDLRFPADRFSFRFCWDSFRTCKTLVGLTLRGEFVLDVPKTDLLFPCLKKLNLVSIVYSSDESLVNLITGCPVLEELFVERQLIGQADNLKTFKVLSPSLKRLRISFALCVVGDYKVVIDAPKLEYINILDVMSTDYSLRRPSSLVEAHISTRLDSNTDSVADLIRSLSSAERLTLTSSALMALGYVDNLNLPTFSNLVKLVLGIDNIRGWLLLPLLLSKMPNLEHLTFSKGLLPFPRAQCSFNMGWLPPLDVPSCLRFKMKEITILNREALTGEEIPLIKYLLKHSEVLEIMRIKPHNIHPSVSESLFKFRKGSTSCQVKLI